MGQLPPPQYLQAVTKIMQSTSQEGFSSLFRANSTRGSIGAGLPPVPEKVVSQIEAAEYIDMSELLPNRLGTAGLVVSEDQQRAPRLRCRVVTNILE